LLFRLAGTEYSIKVASPMHVEHSMFWGTSDQPESERNLMIDGLWTVQYFGPQGDGGGVVVFIKSVFLAVIVVLLMTVLMTR